MLVRIVRPMQRPESSMQYFRQRIPLDVLDRARGMVLTVPIGDSTATKTITLKAKEIRISLRTSDPSLAKERQAIAAAHLERIWQSLRHGPTKLNHKQVISLSGEIYHDFTRALDQDPGEPGVWQNIQSMNKLASEGRFGTNRLLIPTPELNIESLNNRFGSFVDVLLARRSLVVDVDSRNQLLKHVARSMDEAAAKIGKFAEGDYSDDDVGKRFPAWEDTKKPPQAKPTGVSFQSLFDGWWQEAKLNGKTKSTHQGYGRTVRYFRDFIGHDDAARITPEDVIAYKDHRLHEVNAVTGKTASPKTVKDSDLAALKSIFGWGLANLKLPTNPAQSVTIKVGKPAKVRPKYFKPDEREAILTLARNYTPTGREATKLSLAKHWVPWVCAYTGARVGEIAQLRKQDIRKEEGCWVINITPDAGTVKTKQFRIVPIHSHLIDEGFVAFAANAPDGHLFIDIKLGTDPQGKIKALTNKLAGFVRSIVPDPKIAPNHGWRHTFKTLYREIEGYDHKVLDDIVGHAPNTQGDNYGESTIKTMASAMNKFQRLID